MLFQVYQRVPQVQALIAHLHKLVVAAEAAADDADDVNLDDPDPAELIAPISLWRQTLQQIVDSAYLGQLAPVVLSRFTPLFNASTPKYAAWESVCLSTREQSVHLRQADRQLFDGFVAAWVDAFARIPLPSVKQIVAADMTEYVTSQIFGTDVAVPFLLWCTP
jgi:hypothetical protein